MSALTKGINVQSFSRSNLMLTLIVGFVVIALFFIPEIIGFQRSMSGTTTQYSARDRVSEPTAEIPVVENFQAVPEVSPLDHISRLIDAGLSAPMSVVTGTEPAAVGMREGGANVDPNLLAKCVQNLSETPEKKIERNLSESPLTWEKIQSQQAQERLRIAQTEAMNIARALPPKKTSTRYALFTYTNAINAVLAAPDQFASAEEAIGYVETVDQAVTKAMFRESIERADYMRWQQVSLAPLLETTRVARLKSQYRMPFNPRITMEYVGVRQLDPNEQGPAYLDFRGFLFGKDVERVEIYHNGVNVGQLGLGEPDPETGRRYFSYMLADAKGLYTLVAHDVHGEKHKKSYEFFSRTVGRARNDYGTYVVPYNSEEIGTFDPRLDRLFRGGPGSSGDGTSASAFATF